MSNKTVEVSDRYLDMRLKANTAPSSRDTASRVNHERAFLRVSQLNCER